jgi:hypothetical protein
MRLFKVTFLSGGRRPSNSKALGTVHIGWPKISLIQPPRTSAATSDYLGFARILRLMSGVVGRLISWSTSKQPVRERPLFCPGRPSLYPDRFHILAI